MSTKQIAGSDQDDERPGVTGPRLAGVVERPPDNPVAFWIYRPYYVEEPGSRERMLDHPVVETIRPVRSRPPITFG